MAIVEGPALSLKASGNLGAICYSKWRSLQIAKAAWTGTVPNTPKQLVQQAYMTDVSKAWGGSLDADQRLTWINLARNIVWKDRLGSPYIPNGYQLFMKWNIRRQVMGLVIMLVAPPVQEWVYVGELYLRVYIALVIIRVNLRISSGVQIESYGHEIYRAGPYDSGGRHPIEGEWLFVARKVPPSHYDDGDVIANKWYWYRARQISEFGDVGNWWEGQKQYA